MTANNCEQEFWDFLRLNVWRYPLPLGFIHIVTCVGLWWLHRMSSSAVALQQQRHASGAPYLVNLVIYFFCVLIGGNALQKLLFPAVLKLQSFRHAATNIFVQSSMQHERAFSGNINANHFYSLGPSGTNLVLKSFVLCRLGGTSRAYEICITSFSYDLFQFRSQHVNTFILVE